MALAVFGSFAWLGLAVYKIQEPGSIGWCAEPFVVFYAVHVDSEGL